MLDRIPINKGLIPYDFDILLGDHLYNLYVSYNTLGDLFTISLYDNGELLCAGEPVIYGQPLFANSYVPDKFPMVTIVPWDESGNTDKVTYENFGETVFLCVFDGETDEYLEGLDG